MAAPADVTLSNLSAKWTMNKTLSDDTDALLTLQGVSWFMRRAISWATVTLDVKEYVEDSVTHIDIDQTATGGIKGTREERTLDYKDREHSDHIFGTVKGKSRYMSLDDLDVEDPDDVKFLKGEGYGSGFLGGDSEGEAGKRHIESYVLNVDKGGGWDAQQVWGFENIEDKRYYTRRVVVKKGKTTKRARLVYDYNGK